MDSKRGKPYAWVTWITGLLAGTDKCQWKAWVKSNFRYAKRAEDQSKDLSDWTKQHDQMVGERVLKLEREGYTVRTEDENAFKVEGRTAILSGKPDIVAVRPDSDSALVIDTKSGSVKPKDSWQVYIYMWALPLTVYKGLKMAGAVDYRHGLENLPPLTQGHVDRITETMRLVGQSGAPPAAPSVAECRYCDIVECKVRVGSEVSKATVEDF